MSAIEGKAVTVLGAGVGGLASALALARRGARVTVVEQAAELGGAGAGIQISPNGFAVLRALGLGDCTQAALRSRAVVLRDGPSGREVLRMDLGARPYYLFHRPALIAALAEAARAAGVTLVRGCKITTAIRQKRGWLLTDSEHDLRKAQLLVGADGLHSVLRPALNGRDAPFFTGQVAWRAMVPAPKGAPAEAVVDMGPGRHLVSYPLPNGLLNLVGIEERSGWAAEGWSHPGDPDAFRAAFAGFAPRSRGMLERVEQVHLWGLHRHPVAKVWQDGAGVLLGDAAHPTLPFLAQGANLALEDAWVLAEGLAQGGAESLPAYQAAREPRVRRAIAAAERNAGNYHLSQPQVRWAAHRALALANRLLPGGMLGRLDWLYGHDVTAAR